MCLLKTHNEGTSRIANTCTPGNNQQQILLGVYGWRVPDSKLWRIPFPMNWISKDMPQNYRQKPTSINIPQERMIDDRNLGGPIFRIKIVDGGWNVT
jgi:hypothetical protein